jgi:hypothetical protein
LSTSLANKNRKLPVHGDDRPALHSDAAEATSSDAWSPAKKIAFRIAAIFLALTLIPLLDRKFWRALFHSNLVHFQDLFRLTAIVPQYFYSPKWGLASYRNLALVLAIALAAAAAWSYLDRDRKQYEGLYYWLRVLVRYRLGISLIAYGLLQLFPIQFPKPTLSDLHTNYGDYLQWKMFYLTNGLAHAKYEQALGLVEIVGGALLLFQSTVTIGAIVSASLLVNIFMANLAYQLGDHIYATVLLLAASFLLIHDSVRLLNLLVLQKPARADHLRRMFIGEQARRWRLVSKSAFAAFILLYAGAVFYGYHHGNWPLPDKAGTLENSAGYYNVREFEVNGRVIPYSLTDPVRWQDVVFEKWNTISVRSHRPVPIAVSAPDVAYESDQRTYEFAGNAGRRFYSYTVDPNAGTIHLQGKNDPRESIALLYKYAADGSLILTGADESGNALRIVLDKIDKKYLLLLGRRNPLTIY